MAGLDVIMLDRVFTAARSDRLAGLVVTHGHEDHIGAIPYLWKRFRCPVYATPFARALLYEKLVEAGLQNEIAITEVPLSGKFSVGQFEIELITLTHSIPEPNAVVIRTPLGTILHTGDWKLDPDPLVARPPTRRPCAGSGRRAYWPWFAIRPTPWRLSIPGP